MAYGKPRSSNSWLLAAGLGLFAVALVTLLIVRPEGGDDDDSAGAVEVAPPVTIPSAARYPDPPADGRWRTSPLDEETYVQVTAESTCAAQRYVGPPQELGRELDRIYYHYKTTSQEVAAFAVEVNGDDETAVRVGERIARSIENCPPTP